MHILLFPLLFKIHSFLIQYILISIFPPSPPPSSSLSPPDPLYFCLSLETKRILRDNNKITRTEMIKQRCHIEIEQEKSLKKRQQNKRHTCWHTQEPHKNTKQKATIYTQRNWTADSCSPCINCFSCQGTINWKLRDQSIFFANYMITYMLPKNFHEKNTYTW